MIRVLLVDDHELFRSGLRLLLQAERDITVVGTAGDGVAAVRAVREHRPHVVLMDLTMPLLDGVAATERIVAAWPQTRVLMLTVLDDEQSVLDAIEAGASGYLGKDAPPEQMVAAIRCLAAGDAVLGPGVTARLLDHVRPLLSRGTTPARWPQALTQRERDVLAGMAKGYSNAELARTLGVAESTVKTHVTQVLAKLELRDRVHAVIFAYEHGLAG